MWKLTLTLADGTVIEREYTWKDNDFSTMVNDLLWHASELFMVNPPKPVSITFEEV